MSIYGINVDVTRGFDVCTSSGRTLRRFASYEEACSYAAAGRGRFVRYWAVKGK